MADETKRRGFAALTPEQRKEMSSRGGKAAHGAGTAHKFTEEEAREAGRKGGEAKHKKRLDKQKELDTETAGE